MQDKSMSMETRIINAAIDCIEEHGMEGATTRVIAEKAGVNSAAINYYFRSKDRLMEQVIDTALKNAFDWDDFKSSEHMNARDRIIDILDELTEGALHYQRIVRALFYETYARGNYDTAPIISLRTFIQELIDDLLERDPNLERESLRNAMVQIMSAVLLPGMLLPGVLEGIGTLDLNNKDDRRQYIERAVTRLL